MVNKKLCDVCGDEIPDSRLVEHNKATKMPEGSFVYGAVMVYESDDLCETCGAITRDFVRMLRWAYKVDRAVYQKLARAATVCDIENAFNHIKKMLVTATVVDRTDAIILLSQDFNLEDNTKAKAAITALIEKHKLLLLGKEALALP